MKRKAVVVIAVCILFMIAACSNAAVPSWDEETKEYKNDEFNIRFLYPDSWLLLDEDTRLETLEILEDVDLGNMDLNDLIDQAKRSNMIVLLDKNIRTDGSTDSINYIINDKETGLTLEILKQNADAIFGQLETYMTDLIRIDEGTIKTFGSNKAFCIEYKCKLLNVELEYFQAYILGKTKSCIMTFTTRDSLNEKKQIAEEILKFIRLS